MSVPDAAPESCFVDTNIWLYIYGDRVEQSAFAESLSLTSAVHLLFLGQYHRIECLAC